MLPPEVSGQCLEPVSRDSAERLGSLGPDCSDIFESLYCPPSRYYLVSSGSWDSRPMAKELNVDKGEDKHAVVRRIVPGKLVYVDLLDANADTHELSPYPSSSTRW